MKPNSIVTGFIDYLQDDGKADLLPEISQELRQVAEQKDENKKAIITTAVSLTPDEKESLKKNLAQIFQHDIVAVENTIDRTLIGGVRIQLGDILIDASIRGRFERLKKMLLT